MVKSVCQGLGEKGMALMGLMCLMGTEFWLGKTETNLEASGGNGHTMMRVY